MNCFLLQIRCSMDDCPVSLHATEAEAREAGKTLSLKKALCDASNLFGMDPSDFVSLDMIEFRDGKPIEWTMLRCTDDSL